MLRLIVLAALLAAALLTSPAMARQGEGHICFFAMDADHDGVVTPAEFAAAYGEDSRELFASLDANGDGVLTHDEYHAQVP